MWQLFSNSENHKWARFSSTHQLPESTAELFPTARPTHATAVLELAGKKRCLPSGVIVCEAASHESYNAVHLPLQCSLDTASATLTQNVPAYGFAWMFYPWAQWPCFLSQPAGVLRLFGSLPTWLKCQVLSLRLDSSNCWIFKLHTDIKGWAKGVEA